MIQQPWSLVAAIILLAAAIFAGFWYQDYNSPFNQCVRVQKARATGSTDAFIVNLCLRLSTGSPQD